MAKPGPKPGKRRGRPRKTGPDAPVAENQPEMTVGGPRTRGAKAEEPKPEGATYSTTKNKQETRMAVFFVVINFEPVTIEEIIEKLDLIGMKFHARTNVPKLVSDILLHFQNRQMMVENRLSIGPDGMPHPTWKVDRSVHNPSFVRQDPLKFIRPYVTEMQLLDNPETKGWIDYLEKLQQGAQVKRKRTRFVSVWVKLKALQPVLGTKILPDQEANAIYRQLGFTKQDQHSPSFFRRRGNLIDVAEEHTVKMAIKDSAPELWGPNIEFQMHVQCRPVNLMVDRDHDYGDGVNFVPQNEPGTYINNYPVCRTGNVMARKDQDRSTIKYGETAPPGFFVEMIISVPETKGPQHILIPLKRGIYLGAMRAYGQGLCKLVEYKVLGFSDDQEALQFQMDEHDPDVRACTEKVNALLAQLDAINEDESTPSVSWEYVRALSEEEIDPPFETIQNNPSSPPPGANGVGADLS